MPITKHEAAQLRGYISHHMQAAKAQQHGCSIGLTQDELRTRAESARSDLYKFILELTEQNSVEPIKASPKFLDMALSCGARLTGDPDGSNAVEVVFPPAAWQQFDRLVSEKNRAFDEWSSKTAWVQEQISTFPSASLGRHHADVMRDEIQRLRAKVAHLERFTDNHPDTKLLDFLTSRASINFDGENCALLTFEVPNDLESFKNLREIIATAKGEADRDDAEANGEAND